LLANGYITLNLKPGFESNRSSDELKSRQVYYETNAMKTTYCGKLILLFAFSINFCYGQKLNGKVKSYKETYFSVSEIFGMLKKGTKLNDSIFREKDVLFNRNGNITQMIEYNADGTIFCKYKGRDEYKDNLFESIFIWSGKEGVIDKKPFIIESAKYNWGEWFEMDYINDSTGLPVLEIIHDLMGRELHKISIKRDRLGNPLEYNFSNGITEKYKYDNFGNRIEYIMSSAQRTSLITTYKYDVNRNLIEEEIKDFHKMYYHYFSVRNTYEYQYDKQGNWIKQTIFEDLIPKRIVVRTIEYFL
jgi:YD repeat-containing protein